jgi:hypothetical protein
MKKLLSSCLLALVILSVLGSSAILFAREIEGQKIAQKSFSIEDIKAFIGEPIYCKITVEDLEAAREDAKKVASLK